eukprot:3210399-Pyramimonas_sp.AAC.1
MLAAGHDFDDRARRGRGCATGELESRPAVLHRRKQQFGQGGVKSRRRGTMDGARDIVGLGCAPVRVLLAGREAADRTRCASA